MDDLMEILIEVLRDKGEARERREAKTLMLECRYGCRSSAVCAPTAAAFETP